MDPFLVAILGLCEVIDSINDKMMITEFYFLSSFVSQSEENYQVSEGCVPSCSTYLITLKGPSGSETRCLAARFLLGIVFGRKH